MEAACGRTKALVRVASIILIITMAKRATSASHPSRLGHRAKVHRGHRRHALPFVGFLENIDHGSAGRESPSAAPTPQKRGPRRPPRTGRRGRLPTSLATPRQELVVYHIPYKDFLDTVMLFRRIRIGMELRTLVVAVWGGAAALAARAMVAGMAMAIMAPSALNIGRTVPLSFCAKLPLTTGGNAHASHGEVGGIGFIVKPFTPLHTEGRKEKPIAYDMVVWGIPPRSVLALSRLARILALTSTAPRRCGRAWIPVAGLAEATVATPRRIVRTYFDDYADNQGNTEGDQLGLMKWMAAIINGARFQGPNDTDAFKMETVTERTTLTGDITIGGLARREVGRRRRLWGMRRTIVCRHRWTSNAQAEMADLPTMIEENITIDINRVSVTRSLAETLGSGGTIAIVSILVHRCRVAKSDKETPWAFTDGVTRAADATTIYKGLSATSRHPSMIIENLELAGLPGMARGAVSPSVQAKGAEAVLKIIASTKPFVELTAISILPSWVSEITYTSTAPGPCPVPALRPDHAPRAAAVYKARLIAEAAAVARGAVRATPLLKISTCSTRLHSGIMNLAGIVMSATAFVTERAPYPPVHVEPL